MKNDCITFFDRGFSDRILTAEEEIELGKIIREDNENPTSERYLNAFDTLMECNLKLVAKEAFKLSKSTGEDYSELINEGVIGLVKAVKKYDPEQHKDNRFSTYAIQWIKQQMFGFLGTSILIHVPRKVASQYRQYKKLMKESVNEISKEEIKDKLKLTDSELKLVEKANVSISSLSNFMYEDNVNSTISLEDILKETNTLSPDLDLMIKDRDRVMHDLINSLNERDKDIITSYCMADDELTLQKLADKYEVSRERIRQIKEEILHDFKTRIKKMDLRKLYED